MPKQTSMFPNGEDTPLFSGTTQPGKESTFTKKDEPQPAMPNALLCFNCWEFIPVADVLSADNPRCPHCGHRETHSFREYNRNNGKDIRPDICDMCGRGPYHPNHEVKE